MSDVLKFIGGAELSAAIMWLVMAMRSINREDRLAEQRDKYLHDAAKYKLLLRLHGYQEPPPGEPR